MDTFVSTLKNKFAWRADSAPSYLQSVNPHELCWRCLFRFQTWNEEREVWDDTSKMQTDYVAIRLRYNCRMFYSAWTFLHACYMLQIFNAWSPTCFLNAITRRVPFHILPNIFAMALSSPEGHTQPLSIVKGTKFCPLREKRGSFSASDFLTCKSEGGGRRRRRTVSAMLCGETCTTAPQGHANQQIAS